MMKFVPIWLNREDSPMEEMFVPPVAVIPELIKEAPPPTNGHADDEAKIIEQAALQVHQFKQERERLQVLCTEATLSIAAANKRIKSLELDNAEMRNNLQNMATQCEALRQEASDLRAFFSSIRAQLDHFEIPLPVRKRANNKNNKT